MSPASLGGTTTCDERLVLVLDCNERFITCRPSFYYNPLYVAPGSLVDRASVSRSRGHGFETCVEHLIKFSDTGYQVTSHVGWAVHFGDHIAY